MEFAQIPLLGRWRDTGQRRKNLFPYRGTHGPGSTRAALVNGQTMSDWLEPAAWDMPPELRRCDPGTFLRQRLCLTSGFAPRPGLFGRD